MWGFKGTVLAAGPTAGASLQMINSRKNQKPIFKVVVLGVLFIG
jgi:hypothetical protein